MTLWQIALVGIINENLRTAIPKRLCIIWICTALEQTTRQHVKPPIIYCSIKLPKILLLISI